mgnify:CR=1 FL=1
MMCVITLKQSIRNVVTATETVMMVLSLQSVWLSATGSFLTYGYGLTAVSNEYGFDYISSRVTSKLSDGDYYDAFTTFADLSEAFLKEAREGTPYSDDNPAKLTFLSRALPYLMSFGIAFIVALIICSVKVASMKTAVKKTSAADYMEPGSFSSYKENVIIIFIPLHSV